MICIPFPMLFRWSNRTNKRARACGTYGRQEYTGIHSFGGKTWVKETIWKT